MALHFSPQICILCLRCLVSPTGLWAASVTPLNKCSAVRAVRRACPPPAPPPSGPPLAPCPHVLRVPHLCRQAVVPAGHDSRGPCQEELQAGEAEQGQLQPLYVDLGRTEGQRDRGRVQPRQMPAWAVWPRVRGQWGLCSQACMGRGRCVGLDCVCLCHCSTPSVQLCVSSVRPA